MFTSCALRVSPSCRSSLPTRHTDRASATGKTLEEIDALFARSPEVRERLERDIVARRTGAMAGVKNFPSCDLDESAKIKVSTFEKI